MWFALIAWPTSLLAVVATAIGAWMVLPFAGLEVLCLWFAFKLIARHDGDYEWLQVADQQFCWARCECGRVDMLSGNTAWARVFAVQLDGRVEVGLRYQGRTVSVGQMISDEQRQILCRNLARVMK
jgi:uncharacterized membrane protein